MKQRDPSDLEKLMGARPFGRIYKPRWSSDELCSGETEPRADGKGWRCLKCSATGRNRRAETDTTHREMKDGPFWCFRYSHEGKRYDISTRSRDHADAVKLKREVLKRVLGGRLPWISRDEPTLNSLLDMVRAHYASEGNRSTRSLELYIRTLQRFPFFARGAVKARKITEAQVEEYKAWRKADGRANGTVNRELAMLRQGFKMALLRLDENGQPMVERMPRIRLMKEAPPKEGFFEDDEFDRVHAELLAGNLRSGPQDLADLAEFYYVTGWRSAAPRALQWRHVNWFAKTVTLPAGVDKAGKARVWPFGPWPRLEQLLLRRYRETNALSEIQSRSIPWIFHRRGEPIRWFRKAWEAACSRAGVPDRTPHDFRRTACRNLVLAGVDPMTAAALVGWESIAMVKRYKIDTLRDLEAAVGKAARYEQERRAEREAAEQMALRFGKGR